MNRPRITLAFAFLLAGCGYDGPLPSPEKAAHTSPSPAPAGETAAKAGTPAGETSAKTAAPVNAAAAKVAEPAGQADKIVPSALAPATSALAAARHAFTTKIVRRESSGKPVPQPPAGVLQLVQYDSPAGKLKAYVTPAPGTANGARQSCGSAAATATASTKGAGPRGRPATSNRPAPVRKAGIVVMFPSLRGGNDNPGCKEALYGELDDVLAAADWLAAQDFVDPQRIYLGGHSTGGTLALLVAEYSNRFRACFPSGP